MAKRIVWSIQARADRQNILEYWFKRTGNKKYSLKLALQFRETIRLISLYNYLGRPTSIENIRVCVLGDYLLFYKLSERLLEVVAIFDNRRDPAKRIL